jgi:O-antigen ligase
MHTQNPAVMLNQPDYAILHAEQRMGPIAFFIVCLSLFMWTAHPGTIFPFLFYAKTGLITFALSGAVFIACNGPQRIRELAPTGAKLVLALLLIGFVGIPLAIWPGGAFNGWRFFAIHVALYFFWLPAARSTSQLRMLVLVVTLSAGFLASCQFLMGVTDLSESRYSVGGMYDPNDMALVLSTVFPLSVFLFSESGLKGKLFWAVTTIYILTGILATASRGGLLAIGVAVAILIFVSRKALKTWHRLLILSLAVGLFVSPAADPVKERWQTVVSGEDYNFEGGRSHQWRTSIRLIAKNPLIGAGTTCAATALGRYGGDWHTSHNTLLQVGVELGLPGLIIYLLILRAIWRNCGRAFRVAASDPDSRSLANLAIAIRTSLVAFLVGGMFLSQAYSIFLLILLLLSNGVAYAARQEGASCETRQYCEEQYAATLR